MLPRVFNLLNFEVPYFPPRSHTEDVSILEGALGLSILACFSVSMQIFFPSLSIHTHRREFQLICLKLGNPST